VANDRRELRAALEREWPNVPPLAVEKFWAFSPYQFLHLDQFDWSPTRTQVEEAERNLPARASQSYVHERMDSRHPAVFHYIKRPAYVAAFASGEQIRPQQRLGLTFIWAPKGRTVFQSQTAGDETAWGAGGQDFGRASYRIGNREHRPTPGVRNLPGDGPFEITFPAGGGSRQVRFEDDQIVVTLTGSGPWIENIPLMQSRETDELCAVEPSAGVTIERAWRSEPLVGDKRVRVITLKGNGPGKYRVIPTG
jgi:hypothetical protein